VQVVCLAERLALGGIREWTLDERPADGEQGVAPNAMLWVRPARVDDRHVEVASALTATVPTPTDQ